MAEQLQVNLIPIQQCDLSKVQQQWLELEKSANNSIFTHWPFIATWLSFINYQGKLLKVSFKNRTVGLAIITENYVVKNGIKIRQLWLNRTGDAALDQIWNEYNDILCAEGLEHSIRAAVIDYFGNKLTEYDELILGVANENIKETPRPNNIMQHTSWQAISYQTSLRQEYRDWPNYLSTLSKNTRYQIKRSAKLFGGEDQIKVTRANNVDEALNFLSEAAEYHKIRWANHNSGFENEKFVEFHKAFIQQNFHLNIVDIVKIHTDEKTICYLYNFLYKNKVYFYLSGISYSSDNRLKPGLLAHSIAISHYAGQGYKVYDFMGGEGRYKKSLSDKSGTLIVSNFRRKTVPFIISNTLRKLKAACA